MRPSQLPSRRPAGWSRPLSWPSQGRPPYFRGGAVVYTYAARGVFLDLPDAALAGLRPATEPYAMLLANTVRRRLSATWGVAETGATGPTGNRYGDPAGHACLAIAGPAERAITLETCKADRLTNMRAFAAAALDLLWVVLSS